MNSIGSLRGRHLGEWGWFWVWAVVGGCVAISLVSFIGPFFLPVAALGAFASFASYGIALWAMTRAPVATVAALRETSVLFAALLGIWLLRETFTARRAAGTALIVAGVVALRLG